MLGPRGQAPRHGCPLTVHGRPYALTWVAPDTPFLSRLTYRTSLNDFTGLLLLPPQTGAQNAMGTWNLSLWRPPGPEQAWAEQKLLLWAPKLSLNKPSGSHEGHQTCGSMALHTGWLRPEKGVGSPLWKPGSQEGVGWLLRL